MSDRPLSRKLVRTAARIVMPGRAHRADWWPGLRMEEDGALFWHGRPLARARPPSGLMPEGAELVAVIGSGPSLKTQHPERLPPGTAILLNGALSLAARLRPLAVAIEDERFVHRHAAMVAGLPPDVPLMLSLPVIRALAVSVPKVFAGRPVGLLQNLLRPAFGPKRGLDDAGVAPFIRSEGGAAFSLAPDRGVIITGTVAYSALQIALAAAPKEVLLAGIDLSNDSQPRFYESAGRAAWSGLSDGLPRILAGFALARSVAAERGTALGCASPVSALLPLGYPCSGVLA